MDEPNDRNNPASEGSLFSTIIKDYIAPTDFGADAFWCTDPLRSDAWLLQLHLQIGTRFAATSIERAFLVENKIRRFWLEYSIPTPADLVPRKRNGVDFAKNIARNLGPLTSKLESFVGYVIPARAYCEPVLLGRVPKYAMSPGSGKWEVWIEHRRGISGTGQEKIPIRFNHFEL
jgi:hypothetical protein